MRIPIIQKKSCNREHEKQWCADMKQRIENCDESQNCLRIYLRYELALHTDKAQKERQKKVRRVHNRALTVRRMFKWKRMSI